MREVHCRTNWSRNRKYQHNRETFLADFAPIRKINFQAESITMDFKLGAKYQFEKGSWLATANDVGMGVAIGVTRYLYYILPNDLFLLYGRPICNLLGIKTGRDRIRAEGYPTNTTLKVAVVGYGRTGTVRRRTAQTKYSSESFFLLRQFANDDSHGSVLVFNRFFLGYLDNR